jgi:hypothetical protein
MQYVDQNGMETEVADEKRNAMCCKCFQVMLLEKTTRELTGAPYSAESFELVIREILGHLLRDVPHFLSVATILQHAW